MPKICPSKAIVFSTSANVLKINLAYCPHRTKNIYQAFPLVWFAQGVVVSSVFFLLSSSQATLTKFISYVFRFRAGILSPYNLRRSVTPSA